MKDKGTVLAFKASTVVVNVRGKAHQGYVCVSALTLECFTYVHHCSCFEVA